MSIRPLFGGAFELEVPPEFDDIRFANRIVDIKYANFQCPVSL